MAHITADRVRDTSTTTGTGAFAVSGTAPTGYRTFSAVLATNDTCWYAIQHQTAAEWEVGLGTYSSANTITRTTVLSSSNSGSAVSFSAGTKDVFITLAATKTVQLDASGNASALGTVASATLTNATGLPISTGVSGLGTGVATFLATPSSANLASAVTGETGSGALVFGTSPSFTTSALFPDGTASAPSIGHAGDTNTGFWFPAADTIAASTSGLEAMRITSGGDVGIGTSSPAGRFATLVDGGSNNTFFDTYGGTVNLIARRANGTVSSPTTLTADGQIVTLGARGYNGSGFTTSVKSFIGIHSAETWTGSANGTYISFHNTPIGSTARAEVMRIDSIGNVGIGTSSPAAKLDVAGDILTVENSYISSNIYYSGGWKYRGNGYGGAVKLAEGGTGGVVFYRAPNNSSGAAAAATLTESLRIDSSGNLTAYSAATNIGTANTADNILNIGYGATGNRYALTDYIGDTTYSDYGLRIGRYNDGANGTSIIEHRGTGPLKLNVVEAGYIAFATSATERMRIDSVGNLLLGGTSSPTTGTQCLTVKTGTAPTASPADTITIYSTDLSAGNTMLSLYTEGTPVNANTTAAATHRIAIRVNGTVYYLLANTAA